MKENVLIGKEGWLFLNNKTQFPYLLGSKKVSDQSISNFVENINHRSSYFKKLGIMYKHLVFPSKPMVKQKYLPDDYNKVSSLFLKYYKEPLGEHIKNVIYPLDKLKSLEENHSAFHKYDTHNSDFGYVEIANALLIELGLKKLEQDLFDIKKRYLGGDLVEMLQIDDKHEEEMFINKENMNILSFYNKRFLPGNTNIIRLFYNKKAIFKKRLLIFGDSFFIETSRFLSNYFSDVMYLRSSFIHKDIIGNFSPDIVFTGQAERYLNSIPNDNKSNNFLFSLYGDKHYHPDQEFKEALEAFLSYKYYPHIYKKWVARQQGL